MPVKLLTANVGNADIMNCGGPYFFKLCLSEWEETLGENIRKLDPDIVALQEVFDIDWCGKMPPEKDDRKVCYEYTGRKISHQVRRMLGPDYTIVCDGRSHFECIGVKNTLGSIVGCPPGEICRDRGSLTHGVPEGCDTKPVAFGIDVEIHDMLVRVVNAHPAASGEECRAEEVRRVFEGYGDVPPLALRDRQTIVMGDLNLDPFRDGSDSPDIMAWNSHVGEGKEYYYVSGPAEEDPPLPTNAGRTIDHVVTNFASGLCATLGEAPGTVRLDGIDTPRAVMEANDHRALLCDLVFPISTPELPPFNEMFPAEIIENF